MSNNSKRNRKRKIEIINDFWIRQAIKALERNNWEMMTKAFTSSDTESTGSEDVSR